MNENGGKSSTILLTVIGIATLLVVVTGATFAFFAAQVKGADTATSVQIKAAADGTAITMEGFDQVTLAGIYPKADAWVKDKEVSISLPGVEGSSTVSSYSFDLAVTSNDFKDGYLTFTFAKKSLSANVSDEGGTATKTAINGTTGITNIAHGKVARNAETTVVYNLNVYFDEKNENQNDGQEHTAVFYVKMNWTD